MVFLRWIYYSCLKFGFSISRLIIIASNNGPSRTTNSIIRWIKVNNGLKQKGEKMVSSCYLQQRKWPLSRTSAEQWAHPSAQHKKKISLSSDRCDYCQRNNGSKQNRFNWLFRVNNEMSIHIASVGSWIKSCGKIRWTCLILFQLQTKTLRFALIEHCSNSNQLQFWNTKNEINYSKQMLHKISNLNEPKVIVKLN